MILRITICLIEMLSIAESVAPDFALIKNQPCPANRVLTTSRTGEEICKRCTKCPRGFEISHKCNSYNDTVCKPCASAWYNNRKGGNCLPCTGCEAGKYMKRQCTTRRNTVCRRCPRNMFTANLNVTRCLPCKRCQPNEHEISRCGGLKDTLCGECMKEYFRESISGACLPCSECPREYSRLVVNECRQKLGVQHSNICRPGYSYINFEDLEPFQDEIKIEAIDGEHNAENTAKQLHEKLTIIIPVFGVFVVLVFILAGFWGLRTRIKCTHGQSLQQQRHQTASDMTNTEIQNSAESVNKRTFDFRPSCNEMCDLYSTQESEKDSFEAWCEIREHWTSEGNTSSAPDVMEYRESPKYCTNSGEIVSKPSRSKHVFSQFLTM